MKNRTRMHHIKKEIDLEKSMGNQDLQEALNNLSVEVNLWQLLRLSPLVRRKAKHMMKPSALRTLELPIIGHISVGTLDRACLKVDVTIDGWNGHCRSDSRCWICSQHP
ncbi:hypothetical protein O6H91_06G106500 [Diphasiastrum complanatum]|uniref:Uncharacterized protein n=1 Tax=Diphasiastrum complanatum TaxID=34168 RepID=A0ACC2DHQ7_DIPCM|nr:hypothetical protein O6H91_06G106500 [Diphasiastrum complanatum]